jgi:hypothetical protein
VLDQEQVMRPLWCHSKTPSTHATRRAAYRIPLAVDSHPVLEAERHLRHVPIPSSRQQVSLHAPFIHSTHRLVSMGEVHDAIHGPKGQAPYEVNHVPKPAALSRGKI